jgi:hypothetical protein
MRKIKLALLALTLTFTAFASVPKASADPVCPLCIIGDYCCIHGNHAQCIPQGQPC